MSALSSITRLVRSPKEALRSSPDASSKRITLEMMRIRFPCRRRAWSGRSREGMRRPIKRDNANAEIQLLDAGHFALESRGSEIAAIVRDFLERKLPKQTAFC